MGRPAKWLRIKVLAIKSSNLSSTPGAHPVGEDRQLPQSLLTATLVSVHTHTPAQNRSWKDDWAVRALVHAKDLGSIPRTYTEVHNYL